jgi:hypothetical protein
VRDYLIVQWCVTPTHVSVLCVPTHVSVLRVHPSTHVVASWGERGEGTDSLIANYRSHCDDRIQIRELNDRLMLDILPAGHSLLYAKATEVPESMFKTGEIEELVEKMFYTLTMYVRCCHFLLFV